MLYLLKWNNVWKKLLGTLLWYLYGLIAILVDFLLEESTDRVVHFRWSDLHTLAVRRLINLINFFLSTFVCGFFCTAPLDFTVALLRRWFRINLFDIFSIIFLNFWIYLLLSRFLWICLRIHFRWGFWCTPSLFRLTVGLYWLHLIYFIEYLLNGFFRWLLLAVCLDFTTLLFEELLN